MDKQIETTQEPSLNDQTLRDLLDSEVVFVGGGQAVGTGY